MPVLTYSKRKIDFDPALVRDQLYVLKSLYESLGAESFCARMVWILLKEPESAEEKAYLEKKFKRWHRKLVPFIWNKMQHDLYFALAVNNILLKYRQGGATTFFIIMRLLLTAILEPGTSSLLVSQTKIYGRKHFEILKRAEKHFGKRDPFNVSKNEFAQDLHNHLLHKESTTAHELIFDAIDSRVMVDTAENPECGQGLPGVNHFVATELSRWRHKPKETYDNISESVSPRGTKDSEWTANGQGGYAFEQYQAAVRGESIYKAHFFPWPYADEYTVENLPATERGFGPDTEEELTDEERDLQKVFDLTLGQVAWRRAKMIALGEDFFEKYPEDDKSCFLLIGGRHFFESSIVRERYLWCEANVKPIDVAENGTFKIYKQAIRGRNYILHGDVALGKTLTTTEPNYSAFTIIDQETCEEMAAFRDRIPPEDYAFVIQDVARKLYNNAFVGVENNPGGSGDTVLYILQNQFGYSNIYKHRMWYKPPNTNEKQVTEEPGLPTSPKTRPIMLNMLAAMIREHPEVFLDLTFWSECSTFIRDEKGIPRGADNCFDDTVLARAGAVYIRAVRLGLYDPLHAQKETYGERKVEA